MKRIELKHLRNEKDYEDALWTVSSYFDNESETGTLDADRFEALLMLIEKYESKNAPFSRPIPLKRSNSE